MPWVAGGLGGSALVTQGLGGYQIFLQIAGIFWEAPIPLHLRFGEDPDRLLRRIQGRQKARRLRVRPRGLGGN